MVLPRALDEIKAEEEAKAAEEAAEAAAATVKLPDTSVNTTKTSATKKK
jgi:hypothetical protein